MTKDIVTGRSVSIQKVINFFPKQLRLMFNPRRYAIETFVSEKSKELKKRSVVLDAGAGPCPYKKMFSHCEYEATDFKDPYKILDFTCTLDKIPKKNNSYDAVVCTEVLEHVEYPQKVMNELHRILKKGGKLILTCPQEWMVHQKPYNFYYFTNYGLESLLKNAGFSSYEVKPQGGYFWFLADAIKFNSILEQYKNYRIPYLLLKIIEFPFTQIIFPFLLFNLDKIDKNKDWTMGYNLYAIK